MTEPTTVHVTGEATYDVVIGNGVIESVPDLVPDTADRVAVIYQPPLAERAAVLAAAVDSLGKRTTLIEVPDAEAAKSATVLTDCWEQLGAAGFTRTDAVIGLGGGAVTDLAGFVAASWLRGVPIVQVPTTLLAMVDAAVGGKTGINTAAGKNLVGAFHAPQVVVCDLNVLTGMPPRDYAAGLAEVIKCGFISDPAILELIEDDPSAALDPTSDVVAELVQRAVAVKAQVVGDDFGENVQRALQQVGREALNYGHTFAHAIERVENYRWRHGDAVSVGLVYVAELARQAGLIDDELAARHARVLELVGLPTRYDGDATYDELLAAMRLDKKSRGATLRFVVLDGLASPRILTGPDDEMLQAAFHHVRGSDDG